MLKLYDYLHSGNGYKARLLLHQRGIAFELIQLDILAGETRTPAFLKMNPNGKIPLLELEDGRYLAESNAILYFLGQGTPFFPQGSWQRAEVMQWLFFEQYSHEPFIATSRFFQSIASNPERFRDQLAQKREGGLKALAVMEQHLTDRSFMVGEHYSIADIALFAYTHVAPEGGFDLAPYPHINAWLDRVRRQPRHIPITHDNFSN